MIGRPAHILVKYTYLLTYYSTYLPRVVIIQQQ